jgi:nicotinamidase-related amidase
MIVPLSQIDSSVALVVIDLQKGIVSVPTAQPAGEIVERAAMLARTFRERGLPVVLVNVDLRPAGRTEAQMPNRAFPPDWTELVPELEPQPSDHRVTKHCTGAFTGTSLDEYLRGRGVTQIVLAGISTSVGVESTARVAFDLGYNVAFVVDAMTDRDADNHRHSVEKVFPRLGESTTTGELLELLNRERRAAG